jgi:hypothetical protein
VEQVTEVEGDIRSTGLPEGSNPSIPIILFRRVMIYIIILAHWIADFICQTNWMAQNKSKSYKALSLHILSYTVALSLVMFLLTQNPNSFLYALINGSVHFVVDAITSRITSKLYAKGDVHNFFVVIGLDQAIHMVALVATMEVL